MKLSFWFRAHEAAVDRLQTTVWDEIAHGLSSHNVEYWALRRRNIADKLRREIEDLERMLTFYQKCEKIDMRRHSNCRFKDSDMDPKWDYCPFCGCHILRRNGSDE